MSPRSGPVENFKKVEGFPRFSAFPPFDSRSGRSEHGRGARFRVGSWTSICSPDARQRVVIGEDAAGGDGTEEPGDAAQRSRDAVGTVAQRVRANENTRV